uniref:Fatty acid-binding protein, muscle n=1 Tax=Lepeophtheirus salmonis TaxID=72036 RepID=D3PGJ6_LEPSM|nr:Fatty acid-binding protein, muscle [Lepeophtheirus salmonis]
MTFKPLSTLFTRFILSITLSKGIISGTPTVASEEMNNTTNTTSTVLLSPSDSLLTGTSTYGHSNNFEAYLKGLGVPYLLRSLALLASPVVTISKKCPFESSVDEGCLWKIRTDTIFRSHEAEFKLNEESTTTRMDGQTVRFTFKKEGDFKLIEKQTNIGGPDVSTDIIRDFSDSSKMKVNLHVKKVNASSVFYRTDKS